MENEKGILSLQVILAIIFAWIPPLIVWLTQKDFSPEGKDFVVRTLNFEIILFLISVLINFIPILGLLINVGVFVFNLIVCIQASQAVNSGRPYRFPIDLQLIK